MLVQIHDFVMNNLMSSAGTAAIMAEVIFRLIPSDKPKSVCYFISSAAHEIGDVLTGIGNFLDKVLPQQIIKK